MKPLLAEAQVLSQVMAFVGERGRPGSAFVVEENGRRYLVTAAHLANGERDEIVSLHSAFSSAADQRMLTRVGAIGEANDPDVAVFDLDGPILDHPGHVLTLSSDGIMLSQEVLILGYPYNLKFAIGQFPDGSPQLFPMIKRGISGG